LEIPRGNQKSSIEEGQTIQCNRNVWRYQGVIKSRPLKKNRQHNVIERLEDTKVLHCIVCPSSMDDFWLPLGISKSFYYIVLSVLLQWTTFDYSLVSSIEEGQTIQCNRKIWRYQGVIKSRPLKKDRQHNVIERLEDTKG
jgi:hypothetical protein